MSTIGYATLDVIPSMKGLKSQLEKQSSADLTAAGKSGGKKFGDAAGKEAGTSFKSKIGGALKGFNPLAGLAIGAGVVTFLKGSMDEARDAAKVGAQTTSVLTATGGAAKVTATEISNLAGALSAKIGVDDEAIQSGENLLLTFRNIKNEAGAGNDIFNQATTALLDVSSAMGQDIKSSAIQLGKALNDPIKGMSAMARVGVTFTEQQKAQAKAMVASGDVIGAQKIILAELSSEFGGAAAAGHDAGDQLAVAFGNMQESLGTALLPSLASLATVTTEKVIPALTTAGGAVGDAIGLFSSLPTPIKLAAGAFVALRLAAAAGIGTSIAAGVTSLGGAFVGLRIRMLLASDAFATARLSSGRFAASLAGVRAAAIGASAALKSALISTGWGVALIVGVSLLTKFWTAQQEAKAHVQELTDSLNEQTGAFTDATRLSVFTALKDSGAIATAQEFGVSLNDVRLAALGNADAQERVNAQIQAYIDLQPAVVAGGDAQGMQNKLDAADDLRVAVSGQSDAVKESIQAWKDQTEFLGKSNKVAEIAVGVMRDYAGEADKARGAIRKLLAAEDARRAANGERIANELALIEAFQDGDKELKKGEKTLDKHTEAGQANWHSLLDIKDVWNDMPAKMQQADGAFSDTRRHFIDLADEMGLTRKKARALADELLEVPKTAKLKFQSEGYKDRMRELKELRAAADALEDGLTFNFGAAPHGFGASEPTNASANHGNRHNDRTTGTNDRTTGTSDRSVPQTNPRGGVQVNVGSIVAPDPRIFANWAQDKARQASLGGMPM